MRIISGTYKGRVINAPLNLAARPTTDFAKTGLFNILNSRFNFEKITILDLFSGTGNITYEFISRKCKSITAVEQDMNSAKFIKQVIDTLNPANASVIKSDVFSFLKTSHQKFDIVFADPPFDFKQYKELVQIIFENNMLQKNGLFILEHQSKNHFSENDYFHEERKYGNVAFSFFSNLDD